MIAFAAIDLRGGNVVQLVGGRPEEEKVRLPNPAKVARRWAAAGFAALHVVDLDGALGTGSSSPDAVRAIIDAVDVPVQAGGGIRTDAAAAALLDAGAARVVVGTRAVEEPDWLRALALRHPERVVVAADVRAGRVVTRGWTESSALAARDLLRTLEPLPLAGVLVTDVDREGRLAGANAEMFADLAAATRHPLLASGGITTFEDLQALERGGAAGVVLGMSLYTGALEPRVVVQRYSTWEESA